MNYIMCVGKYYTLPTEKNWEIRGDKQNKCESEQKDNNEGIKLEYWN